MVHLQQYISFHLFHKSLLLEGDWCNLKAFFYWLRIKPTLIYWFPLDFQQRKKAGHAGVINCRNRFSLLSPKIGRIQAFLLKIIFIAIHKENNVGSFWCVPTKLSITISIYKGSLTFFLYYLLYYPAFSYYGEIIAGICGRAIYRWCANRFIGTREDSNLHTFQMINACYIRSDFFYTDQIF